MELDPAEQALDQLMDRALRGETVSAEQLAADLPGLDAKGRGRLLRVLALLQGEDQAGARVDGGSRLPFERLGPYQLLRPLGGGGMGMVYLARHATLGRDVALKLIRPSLAASTAAGQRFRREAMAVARLRHENLATVHDAGEDQGVPYLAMEYVPGRGLDEILAECSEQGRTLPAVDAIRWARDVARALCCAHQAGLIHRDVKPSNIRVTPEGKALLLDFGLVVGADLHAVSQDQAFRGTAHYASPEQVAARPFKLDARTDLYSLGVTLYEAVTGQVPFRGETTEQIFHQILSRTPRFPRRLNPGISRDLEAVILGCMEKDRERRYATAQALADDLEALLQMRPVQIRPQTAGKRALQWMRRHPAPALALVVVVGGPLGYAFLSRSWARQVAEQRDDASRQRAEVLRLADVLVVGELLAQADELWPRIPQRAASMQAWLARAREVCERAPEHHATLARLSAAGAPQDAQIRWQRATTLELLGALERLQATISDVEQRAEFARELAVQTIDACAAEWQDTCDEVAIASLYGGRELEPQVGLVPLGFDADSGLAEFWHVETGSRPERDAATGRLQVTADSGMVFVLLPGGESWMGADPAFDPHAMPNEKPAHRVTLAAFFIARHEMTQGQWLRVTGEQPSGYGPHTNDGRKPITLAHPVEGVSWLDAARVLARLGLVLPTEEQWEYAARAGTRTAWWTGPDPRELATAANVVDQYCERNGGHPDWRYEPWDDGYCMHAPAGSYRPNAFGLHDVLGNVEEWCRGEYGFYERGSGRPPLPMEVEGRAVTVRVARGGSFLSPATEARCAVRYVYSEDTRANFCGVRAVRELGR